MSIINPARSSDSGAVLGDEAKPTCERCNAANVECAGYEQKRHIEPRPFQPAPSSTSSPRSTVASSKPHPASPASIIRHAEAVSSLHPKFRTDGLPLIALPVNPRPDQRPHTRARDLLAWHQFLFRTLPLLFPEEHLHFWRDRLCGEAWETEYIFLTIAALGGLHRAVLMMSTSSQNDKVRGLDTKVIAVQTYTEALRMISEDSQGAECSLDLFIGALVLLAYFECAFGNIPAAIGHTNEATHYFLRMQSDGGDRWTSSLPAIDCALRHLGDVCHVVLPLLTLGTMDSYDLCLPATSSIRVLAPTSSHMDTGSTSALLQHLFAFADSFPEVKALIWDPLKIYESTVLPSQVLNFQEQLGDWMTGNNHIFSHLDPQIFSKPTMDCDWDTVDTLTIPPRPYSAVPSHICLFAAVHSFYMARTCWALSLHRTEHGGEKDFLTAYCYIYKVMRATATIVGNEEGVNDKGEGYMACETLGIGLLPMLHMLGQCCPQPTWLRWIMEQLIDLRQEGLFNGEVLAKSLNALYTFELSNNLDSSSMLDRFPSPSSRVISVLLPDLDGQSYVAFYATSEIGHDRQGCATYQRYPVGHARWSNVRRGGTTKPDIEMYNEQRKLAEPFTRDWLLKQKVAQDWITWSANVGFNFDRALRDHISGSCLENAVYEESFR